MLTTATAKPPQRLPGARDLPEAHTASDVTF